MSKAFFQEDTVPVDEPVPQPVRLLPPGESNLVTPAGAAQLAAELQDCLTRRAPLRPADSPEQRQESSRLDRRIRHLQASLQSAEIVAGPPDDPGRVGFGATVTVQDPAGQATTYRIVGVDEAAPEQNRISWLSPVARALQGARGGETVSVRAGRQPLALAVTDVHYD